MKLPWVKKLSLLQGILFSFVASFPVAAQTLPDATLPTNSLVTPKLGNVLQIDGGTKAGSNLFHSFLEFSVPTGGTAFFNNALDVSNIFSRVTGRSASNIDGILKANGTANLFLLNPNGIIFGKNAQLNIGGSFVATTANAIIFGNQGIFSATTPNSPALLTVNPTAMLYNQLAAQEANSIENQGNLQVNPGNSLLLIGGNISPNSISTGGVLIDGTANGKLYAPGGRIEVGGLAAPGKIELSIDAKNPELMNLRYPIGVERANVSLTNGAYVDVSAGNGGSVAIRARNFQISGLSHIIAGIAPAQVSTGSVSGDITINATGVVSLDNSSINNSVFPGGSGNAGNTEIRSQSLFLTNGAQLGNVLFGKGNLGDINITVSDNISVDGAYIPTIVLGQSNTIKTSGSSGIGYNGLPSEIYPSAIANVILPSAVGNTGKIVIYARNLFLSNGAEIGNYNFGHGNLGELTINIEDDISVNGLNILGAPVRVGSATLAGAVGNAGDVNIKAGNLNLDNGAKVISYSEGQGNAGNVNIAATNINFNGAINGFTSGAESALGGGGVGNGGDVNINAQNLNLTNSGQIISTNYGEGKGGNVNINATILNIATNASIITSNFGRGYKGGNVNINATTLNIAPNAVIRTSNFGGGDSGSINIKVSDNLDLSSNASLESDTLNGSTGKGGDINLDIKGKILLTGGATANTGESTRITSSVEPGAIGQGGTLNINAGSLVLTNGAILKSSTQGSGNAGNVNINAGVVDISGSVPSSGLPSGIFTSTNVAASAGNILINTGSFRIADGAAMSARSTGNGAGGKITVNASSTFEAVNGGQLLTTTSGKGQAGSIDVNANLLTLSGSDANYYNRIAKFPQPVSDFVANAITETGSNSGIYASTTRGSTGAGGTLSIAAKQFTIRDGAQVTTSSFGTGDAGNILSIRARNLYLDNGAITSTSKSGNGGDIPNIQVQDLLMLQHGSNISTTAGTLANGGGNGGNININAGFLVALPSENSNITANAFAGRGGNIQISTQGIFGISSQSSQRFTNYISASSQLGVNGVVTVNAPEINPSRGLVTLPTRVVDASRLVAQGCSTNVNSNGSRFVVTGSGGLPTNPADALSADAVIEDVRLPPMTAAISPSNSVAKPLVEATGWVVNEKGEVVLVAKMPSPSCQAP